MTDMSFNQNDINRDAMRVMLDDPWQTPEDQATLRADLLEKSSLEERLQGLDPSEVLTCYAPEERLRGLSPDDILRAMNPEQIKTWLKQTVTTHPTDRQPHTPDLDQTTVTASLAHLRAPDCPLAIIGLGYVGLPLAVEFGKHRPVVGFDIHPARIAELQAGHDRTREVSADDLAAARHLQITNDPDALRACRIFIVTVPTPVDNYKRPDLTPLLKASATVGQVLKPGDLVIYESTVYPGCTEDDCVPVLARHSGLTYLTDAVIPAGKPESSAKDGTSQSAHPSSTAPTEPPPPSPSHAPAWEQVPTLQRPVPPPSTPTHGFYCGYSPERINPGDHDHRLTTIKKVTSGSTPEVAAIVDALYRQIITAGTHPASSIRVAEAAKVIENTQRDLNIALMNELALLFDKLGIDTLEVLEAAGSKWNFLPFRPGLVGGHCIGVDPYYLTHKAVASDRIIRIHGCSAQLRARSTARRQPAIKVSRRAAGMAGSKRRSACQSVASSDSSCQKPTARPARKAAPRAVVSVTCGRTTATPSKSA